MTFPLDFFGSFFHSFIATNIPNDKMTPNCTFGIKNTKKIVPPPVCLGIKIVIRISMEDFTVKRLDGPNGKHGWYMYIGFCEKTSKNDPMIDCYGIALLLRDGKKRYWFNYSFNHSRDWNEITNITLRPAKKYQLSLDNLCEVSSDIIHHILDFISMRN